MMRKGFTTGSCAAAAAKAAAFMLFTKTNKEKIKIMTPAGVTYEPEIKAVEIGTDYASCGVIKDSGDDPDSTNGIMICAKVTECRDIPKGCLSLKGGIGVGIVTKKGLEMPVGEYAINSVPREMIAKEVEEVLCLLDADVGVEVEIFVPQGREIAPKTFNPRMGIEGGISILGTSGIVEPMSSEALIRTIELDIRMKKAAGREAVILVPGNYGETFLKNTYGIDPESVVLFSNYMGIAVDKAVQEGFKKILVCGHTGKLVKVSGGIMNTHSKEADCRMELMLTAALRAAERKGIQIGQKRSIEILSQMTTTGVLDILQEMDLLSETCQDLLENILFHLKKRAGEGIEVECILYENSFGLLAMSEKAESFL